jgi:spectinomycin phosphotransferase
MLEKPDLPDDYMIACLHDAYGLPVRQIAFLPLGADSNTAVYRAVMADDTAYFVKLRRGVFDEMSVVLPKFLSDLGIRQIIGPLATKTGQLWAPLEQFTVTLYPFIEGRNGYDCVLSDNQWVDFGRAMKSIHTAVIPPSILTHIQRETYSSQWRNIVKGYMEQVELQTFQEPIAARLATFLRTKRAQIVDLIGRTERLAQAFETRSREYTLCHADIHAGNILLDAANTMYIVDWDTAVLAPKERDLMFIGSGLMGNGRTLQEEQRLFYHGYGQTAIDPIGIAYYRYERIIQDIAAFCEEIFLTLEGDDDREQSLRYLVSNFQPGGVLDIAYSTDRAQ